MEEKSEVNADGSPLYRVTMTGHTTISGKDLWHHASKMAKNATLEDVINRLDPEHETSIELEPGLTVCAGDIFRKTGILDTRNVRVNVENVRVETVVTPTGETVAHEPDQMRVA